MKEIKKDFDIIVVGSGLSALSTIYGIQLNKKKYKIALITGKPKFNIKNNHPKIFKDLMNFRNILSHKLRQGNFSLPGNISGLAFFWGQQCNINENKNSNKKSIFKVKKFFSNFFKLKNGKKIFEEKFDDLSAVFETPDETLKQSKLLLKFKNYFKKRCHIFYNEAVSINKNQIILDNGAKICGDKIFLCTGLIGTINLIRSMNDKVDFTFNDHSPSIDLIYAKSKSKNTTSKNIYSMICKIYSKKNKIQTYSKFYPLNSLEILFFIGRLKFYLPKLILNYKLNIKGFYFVQKWSNSSISEYKIKGFSLKIGKTNFKKFAELNKVYKNLNYKRLFTFTPKLLNFHFHNLKVIKNNKKYKINTYLKKINPNVYCPGMLSQEIINCLPPSFNSFVKIIDNLKKI